MTKYEWAALLGPTSVLLAITALTWLGQQILAMVQKPMFPPSLGGAAVLIFVGWWVAEDELQAEAEHERAG